MARKFLDSNKNNKQVKAGLLIMFFVNDVVRCQEFVAFVLFGLWIRFFLWLVVALAVCSSSE
jgi:hypothetical protein